MSTSADPDPDLDPVRDPFREAFERLPFPAVIVERWTTAIVHANAAARLQLGLDGADRHVSDGGARLSDVVEGTLDQLVEDLRIAAGGGDVPLGLRSDDGPASDVHANCRVRPIGLAGGRPDHWLVTCDVRPARLSRFQDLSVQAREAAEMASRERLLRRRLSDDYETLERFAHAMAHDLKGPFRHIGALLPVIEDGLGTDLPPDLRRLLEAVRASAERGRDLIEALLTHAGAVSGEVRRVSIDLDRAVEDVVAARRIDLRGVDHRITVDRPLGTVEADPALVQILIDNLLANAIKYRCVERPLRIQISGGGGSDDTVLVITDNGVGFDASEVETMFEPFQRLERPVAVGTDGLGGRSSASVEGHGIGLATCRTICHRHGWSLSADGRRGRGARFRVTVNRTVAPGLPLVPPGD